MHDLMEISEKIKKETKGSDVLINEPMSGHTSFKIGGPADIFVDAAPSDVPAILEIAKEAGLPFTIIGNGSNLLCADAGIRGLVLCLGKNASKITEEKRGDESLLTAGAGELLSSLSKYALNSSLKGLEFASGIPGSVGGAVFMNAGAYDGEVGEVIETVEYIDILTLKTGCFQKKDCDFSYRHSIFQDEKRIVTLASFLLKKGDKEEISEKIRDFTQRRKDKQPIEYPSAGSTFKRPKGFFAGKLISDAGLKGKRVGGAVVSEKHAGFVINDKNASAKDVIELTNLVKETVLKEAGVSLELEIRLVGEF